MTIKFSAMKSSFDNFIFPDNAKTVTRTPVTTTNDNSSGGETFSDGTPDAGFECTLFRKEDNWSQKNEGLFDGADAVALIKIGVTLNKNDKITDNGEIFRVKSVVTREPNETPIYQMARLFLI